ncbi:MAG: hypothetical protein SGJ07_16250 [Rhodospirillaceae bacterium]|nr:hypothetical protein [Rhodospirillaceae bacterium]
MVAATARRVPASTAHEVNERIREETEARLAYFLEHPEEIPARLEELDHEWDIERMLETNASALAFTGIVLGSTVDRRWLALPALVTAFLFQHAIQGWCPPLPVLRRLGYRTAEEIGRERYALRAMRGDFDRVAQAKDKLAAILQAVGLRRAGS